MSDPIGLQGRAEQRFERLRREAQESAASGIPGTSAPSGWCISTVARLVAQDEPSIARIQEVQSLLAPVGELHVYPRESLHISLLGCTQREPERQPARGKRMDDIAQAFERAAVGVDSVRVRLGGLNLIGPQFFIEVLTEEPGWSSLRERLAAELVLIGENPMTHADPEPMHLNIARILGLANPAGLHRLLAEDRPIVDETLALGTIELVVTDFVLAPATLAIARTTQLGHSATVKARPAANGRR